MRLGLLPAAVAAVLLAVACSAQPSEQAEPTTTAPPPTTTVPPAACLGEFRQEWSAYGWERCLLGDLFGAAAPPGEFALSVPGAAALLGDIWRRHGAGATPELVTCESGYIECEDGDRAAFASETADGERFIVVLSNENINAIALLHEATHHLIGIGHDDIAGGHGMAFRCAAVDLYGTYAASLVPLSDLVQYLDVCGIPAASVEDRYCPLSISALAAAAEQSVVFSGTLGGAEDRIEQIDSTLRGIEGSWQGDAESKRQRIAELEAEREALLAEREALLTARSAIPDTACSVAP
ncbi:hypothetical protein [Candidatus Poriferisodalis sp.]|uniref:hypothetical protein n=1 Tax=Candidatus Poriferisodalis sp. TaxID=3101277 RepID=UPI003B5C4A91